MKNRIWLWVVSLILLSCSSAVLGGCQLLGITLPDPAVRGLGIVALGSLALFAFASFRRWTEEKRSSR